MPESSPSRMPTWVVFLGAALSTVTATAIATTAAVAVAEHDHAPLQTPAPAAACASTPPVDVALSRALHADADLFDAPSLEEDQVLDTASRYHWFLEVHEEMSQRGAVAWAKKREAALRELAHDLQEMRRLEAAARELEAKHRALEASAED